VSFLLISFSPRFRRVTPISSLDPRASTAAASSSSSHYLFFLFFLPLPSVSFAIRFCFWLVAGRADRADLALSHGGDSFTPVARRLPRKGERIPQGRPREANSRARRRSSSRCSFNAAANRALCLPRFFTSLAQFFLLSVCQVSLRW